MVAAMSLAAAASAVLLRGPCRERDPGTGYGAACPVNTRFGAVRAASDRAFTGAGRPGQPPVPAWRWLPMLI
jgi:hypothetical protein